MVQLLMSHKGSAMSHKGSAFSVVLTSSSLLSFCLRIPFVVFIITRCYHRRGSHLDCESFASIIVTSCINPCSMVLSLPCGQGSVRVHERPRSGGSEPPVAYRAAYNVGWKKKIWGKWSTSIKSTIASLLPKLKLKKEAKDALWAETLK